MTERVDPIEIARARLAVMRLRQRAADQDSDRGSPAWCVRQIVLRVEIKAMLAEIALLEAVRK